MQLCGRADLVRLLSQGHDEQFLAALIGYEISQHMGKEAPADELITQAPSDMTKFVESYLPQPSHIDWAPLPFYYATGFSLHHDTINRRQPEQMVTAYGMVELSHRQPAGGINLPETPPLASWPRLRRRVAGLLEEQYRGRHLDVEELLRHLTRGRLPRELPFRLRRRWPHRLNIVVDRSRRLTPFWQDQIRVIARLRRQLGRTNVNEFWVYDGILKPVPTIASHKKRTDIHNNPSVPVLVLGDCGSLSGYSLLIHYWASLARNLDGKGIRIAVLFPGHPGRWPQPLKGYCKMAPWEKSRIPLRGHNPGLLDGRAQYLLSLVSYASRVEPGLLRTIRRLLPPGEADAGIEAEVWSHPDIASGASIALTITPEVLPALREQFRKQDPELRRKIYRAIREWRRGLPKEIWHEELLNFPLEDQKHFSPAERKAALEDMTKIYQTILSPEAKIDPEQMAALYAWHRRLRNRIIANEDLWKNTPGLSERLQAVDSLVYRAAVKLATPAGYDLRWDGEAGPERFWTVEQTGDEFRVAERPTGVSQSGQPGSPVAILRSTRPYLHGVTGENLQLTEGYLAAVYLDPQSGKVTEACLTKPPWAEEIGEDAHGIWATLRYGDAEQRLRWIPPGQFLMGSSETEAARDNDEDQHPVTLTRGFWLFDTPVTQALWQAVMGNNPSNFKGQERPVEQVSWNDCREFIDKLNRELPGLELQLPSEAQWEYACRAGTTTPFSTGDNLTTDQANYNGNYPYKEYPKGISRGETTPVGSFAPNGWGLYDMHGNVWEWCADWWQTNLGSEAVIDPAGPSMGANRVSRGGGWIGNARYMRAAYRSHYDPGYRSIILGFRCARVQVPANGSSGPGGAGQAADAPQGRAELYTGGGTKYVISPQNSAAITVPRSRRLQLQSDQGILTLSSLAKPEWAEEIGRDRSGLWLCFKYGEVTQRLRWIPPGQFMMGSPKEEAGRDSDEKQHPVTLTRGFWLFDTPVTQALWEAVMGDNPSEYKRPTRPVETINWEDCIRFIEKLNAEMPGLTLTLPSEAQWEYACRAGTATATYAGDLEIKGANNAPLLDDIAWYGGNSGVDFELKKGSDSSSWPDKQYDHKRAGTHPVALKRPNPWGLYDMLGNVWEWCVDRWQADLGSKAVVDPTGPEKGADRVCRGGSWISNARRVRAAYRYRYDPGYRYDSLGFRCARVQDA